MRIQLFGNPDADCFIPQEITEEPYKIEWEGQLNDLQFMWLIKQFPNCEICPWKDWTNEGEVIGITIYLAGNEYQE